MLDRGVIDMQMADLAYRRGIAATHAGRTEDAHLRRVRARFESIEQRLGTLEFAGDRVADANSRGGRWSFALLHHVEMGIEGRDLIDGRLWQPHFFTQCAQMTGR